MTGPYTTEFNVKMDAVAHPRLYWNLPAARTGLYLLGDTIMTANTETPDTRRKRLRFRSWHRGMQEMDLLLGRFADAHLSVLSDAELEQFEALLHCGDPDLYAWITGIQPWPAQFDNALTRRLVAFTLSGPGR